MARVTQTMSLATYINTWAHIAHCPIWSSEIIITNECLLNADMCGIVNIGHDGSEWWSCAKRKINWENVKYYSINLLTHRILLALIAVLSRLGRDMDMVMDIIERIIDNDDAPYRAFVIIFVLRVSSSMISIISISTRFHFVNNYTDSLQSTHCEPNQS